MAEEAIGAVRLGALEKLDHIAPASRLLDVCEADIVRYGYDAAAGECAAYLAGLFESAAIENLVPRDERRLCPPEAPVPAARLRALFIDYAKRNLADLHKTREEERRGGKECVRTRKTRGVPCHLK